MSRLLFINGRVHTPADPGATALLTDGDRIAWVGHEGAALAQRDGVDRVIDLAGALVTPAFVDAHVHTVATGMDLVGLDLTGCRSGAEVVAAVAQHCRDLPAGQIVVGHGWDESTWADASVPDRQELDAAAPGVAVYLTRIDVHSALASTALFEAIPDLTGLAGYSPSGWLRADAHYAARDAVLAQLPDDQRGQLHQVTLDAYAANGIAAVHEMAGPKISPRNDLEQLLARAGGDNPIVLGYWGELGGAATATEIGAVGAAGDLFADGALGSHTASLCHAYSDDPTCHGEAYLDVEQVRDHVVQCAEAGIQAGFHAIGDAALEVTTRGMALAAAEIGADTFRRGRHRLEHVEMPSTEALQRICDLGVTVSAQPVFEELWGGPAGMYTQRLGAERVATMNPFASFQRGGAPLAFSSDAPVTPIDPWRAVSAAVHHHNPDQRISARSAFTAHSRGGWRAAGIDDAGVLAPGQAAHLAVWGDVELVVQAADERISRWSTDPSSGTPVLPQLGPDSPSPSCLATVAAGRIIYDAGRLG